MLLSFGDKHELKYKSRSVCKGRGCARKRERERERERERVPLPRQFFLRRGGVEKLHAFCHCRCSFFGDDDEFFFAVYLTVEISRQNHTRFFCLLAAQPRNFHRCVPIFFFLFALAMQGERRGCCGAFCPRSAISRCVVCVGPEKKCSLSCGERRRGVIT